MPKHTEHLWIQRWKHNSCTQKPQSHRQVNEDSYAVYLASASHPCICLLKFYPFKVNLRQQASFIFGLKLISFTPRSPEHFLCIAIRTLNPDYLEYACRYVCLPHWWRILSGRDHKDLYYQGGVLHIKQDFNKNVLEISRSPVTEFEEVMFSWYVHKGRWITLFLLLTFKHLLTVDRALCHACTMVVKIRKTQLCPAVAPSPARGQ